MVTLYINNKNALTEWGAYLAEGSLVNLMKPVPNKAYLENKSAVKDGKEVLIDDTLPALRDERDVSLSIFIEGSTQEQMLARWQSLVTELYKGKVTMHTSLQPTVKYKLLYKDCSELRTFFNRRAKFTFKFNEPNPADRS